MNRLVKLSIATAALAGAAAGTLAFIKRRSTSPDELLDYPETIETDVVAQPASDSGAAEPSDAS